MIDNKCTHPDGHDWDITIWDDGERRCEYCIHCRQQRIVEHGSVECQHCHKMFTEFHDTEFILWNGVCAECYLAEEGGE